jgi:hypothetical protein
MWIFDAINLALTVAAFGLFALYALAIEMI